MSTCPCCGVDEAGLVNAAELARRHQLDIELTALVEGFGSNPMEFIGLTVPDALAALMRSHGQRAVLDELKRKTADDARHLLRVREVQGNMARLDGPGHIDWACELVRLGPGAVRRADRFQAALESVRAAREMASPMVALTAPDREPLPDAGVMPVKASIPTLAHWPTRNRLRLASNAANRRMMGYGGQHRIMPTGEPDSAAAELSETREGNHRQDRTRPRSARYRRTIPRHVRRKPKGRR